MTKVCAHAQIAALCRQNEGTATCAGFTGLIIVGKKFQISFQRWYCLKIVSVSSTTSCAGDHTYRILTFHME